MDPTYFLSGVAWPTLCAKSSEPLLVNVPRNVPPPFGDFCQFFTKINLKKFSSMFVNLVSFSRFLSVIHLVARTIRNVNSRESIRASHSQLTPLFL